MKHTGLVRWASGLKLLLLDDSSLILQVLQGAETFENCPLSSTHKNLKILKWLNIEYLRTQIDKSIRGLKRALKETLGHQW